MKLDVIAKNLLEKKVCAGCINLWSHTMLYAGDTPIKDWCEFHQTRPEEDTCENWKWSFMAVFPKGREHS
jgi:hypothetical protein